MWMRKYKPVLMLKKKIYSVCLCTRNPLFSTVEFWSANKTDLIDKSMFGKAPNQYNSPYFNNNCQVLSSKEFRTLIK